MTSGVDAATLRATFRDLLSSPAPPPDQYVLALPVGAGYAAVSSDQRAALLLPLPHPATAVARTAGGCVLRSASAVEFSFGGRKWSQAAAILECTDRSMLDAFAVLVLDVANRLLDTGTTEWKEVAHLVDQWQALLARRRRLSEEDEIGIWGEVWFLSQARNPDRLVE